MIAGNHDWVCARKPRLVSQILSHATYLAVPIILGQTNFFLSFDVTFRRKQTAIELAPAQ